jgi:hypothetical protein
MASKSTDVGPSAGVLFQRWAMGAVAAAVAEAATFPLDFTKTRLQLQNEMGRTLSGEVAGAGAPKLGMFSTFRSILATEGLLAMYSGLPAAAGRQMVYGGIGVGLYTPMRNLIVGEGVDAKDAPLWKRMLAGSMTGALGQAIANPFDVVKVRMQADGRLKAVGGMPRYKGTGDAFMSILREEGAGGFFKGITPSLQRAAVINGCGIASYDQTKVVVKQLTGKTDGLIPQVVAAFVSGFISAAVSTPFDVLKTRMMNQKGGAEALYKSTLDCAMKTMKHEGVFALYKGFVPAYTRLGPHRLVHFLTLEQITKFFGFEQM